MKFGVLGCRILGVLGVWGWVLGFRVLRVFWGVLGFSILREFLF